ncbi:MAG: lipid-A-disaccharide synthase [Shimia sp.]
MRVYITAGEPSGDRLGAALMNGLRTRRPDIDFAGIAGPLMQAQGMTSLFPMEELSVMGLAEILPKYRVLKRRIRETAEAALAFRPDVIVTIDSPDFSLRVAKLMKGRTNVHRVHYVAPTVWAWRPKRAERMVGLVDQVLALLPFEPPYLERVGIPCDFVGHPVVTEPVPTAEEVAAFRAQHGFDGPLIAILPGSRHSEVARMMPVFGAALNRQPIPNARLVLPTLPHLAEQCRIAAREEGQEPVILDGGGQPAAKAAHARRIAMAAADIALANSGTISLELAAVGTPMVIAGDMAWLTRKVMERMLLIDTVTLVNLVDDSRTVPEFLGSNFQPAPLADALRRLHVAPDEQKAALSRTMDKLGRGAEPPGLRAAGAILSRL